MEAVKEREAEEEVVVVAVVVMEKREGEGHTRYSFAIIGSFAKTKW